MFSHTHTSHVGHVRRVPGLDSPLERYGHMRYGSQYWLFRSAYTSARTCATGTQNRLILLLAFALLLLYQMRLDEFLEIFLDLLVGLLNVGALLCERGHLFGGFL